MRAAQTRLFDSWKRGNDVILSQTGEVADFLDADQFQWRNGQPLSQFECGFFAVALCKAMAEVGHEPSQTAQVIAEAEAWYAQYDGSDAVTNTDGMSLPQLYELLAQVGLHYQAIATNIGVVKQWVGLGYPVIIAVTETSVRDLALGDANPYPWTPAGTHVIVVTGLAADGSVLVRDSANCTSLYNPASLRPGPRHYDAARLQLVSATVVVPAWLPRPASASPPATPLEESSMLTIAQAAGFFEAIDDQHWRRKDRPEITIHTGLLAYYQSFGPAVFAVLGLPDENEHPVLDKSGHAIPHTAMQRCERGVLCYDPQHQVDGPPYAGDCYNLHIDNDGPGADPRVAQLSAQLLAAQKAAGDTSGVGNAAIEAVREIKAIVEKVAV